MKEGGGGEGKCERERALERLTMLKGCVYCRTLDVEVFGEMVNFDLYPK